MTTCTTPQSLANVASDTREKQRRREGPFKSTLRGGEKDAEYLLRRACNAYVPPQPQEGGLRGRVDKKCPSDMLWHVAGWMMGTDGILKFHDGFTMFFMGLLHRFRSKVSQVTLWKMISNWPGKLNMKSKHLAQIYSWFSSWPRPLSVFCFIHPRCTAKIQRVFFLLFFQIFVGAWYKLMFSCYDSPSFTQPVDSQPRRLSRSVCFLVLAHHPTEWTVWQHIFLPGTPEWERFRLTYLAGKWTLWRCISSQTWGYSIAISVYQRVDLLSMQICQRAVIT